MAFLFKEHARIGYLALVIQLILSVSVSASPSTSNTLLPGATIYDVTNPEAFGGNPELKATPGFYGDDDALAINAAIKAAVEHLGKVINNNNFVFQQVIYIPEGHYHIETPIIVPPVVKILENGDRSTRKENGIWIMGAGDTSTFLELKKTKDIGMFGSKSQPSPIIQFARYTHGTEGSGNINFQLWATDFQITVPNDQPNAIGVSYGCANMGGVRNLKIKAAKNAGHTGFALIQYNNGPGWIENVTIEGFDTGIEISDGWGESFAFSNIAVINQNKGGKGISLCDKLIAIENFISIQEMPDVVPVHLFDNAEFNSEFGGAPHLTLLNSKIVSPNGSAVPAIKIDRGHSFIRNLTNNGYNDIVLEDHNKKRNFIDGKIDEYVSIHGNTIGEKENVAIVSQGSPVGSINLPAPATPEIPNEVWERLEKGDYTLIDQNDIKKAGLKLTTDWAILDPSKSDDDTELIQWALNSGAKYIGLLNNEPFLVSENIKVNSNVGKVELIYGYMSEILVAPALGQKQKIENEKILFTIETGESKSLTIKGIRVTHSDSDVSDFLLFMNNSTNRLIIEDFRCKDAPRGYRNGPKSYGAEVFFENVEFAYNGVNNDVIMLFDQQKVVARQFNLEAPITAHFVDIEGKKVSRYTTQPKLVNKGGTVWVMAQKLGEYNGVFVETSNGGKTELLSVYFNQGRDKNFPPASNATNFLVTGAESEICLVGQERIRTPYNNLKEASDPLPHGDQFGIAESSAKTWVLKGTDLPTYLKYPGFDPFNDQSFNVYEKQNHFRVAGLIRIKNN